MFGVLANLNGLVETLAGLSCTQFCTPMCASGLNPADRFSAASGWDAPLPRRANKDGEAAEAAAARTGDDLDHVVVSKPATIQTGSGGADAGRSLQVAVDDAVGSTTPPQENGRCEIPSCPESRELGREICFQDSPGSAEHKRRQLAVCGGAVDQDDRSAAAPSSDDDEFSGQLCRPRAGKETTATSSVHTVGAAGATGEQVSKGAVQPVPRSRHSQRTFAWRRQEEEVWWTLACFTMLLIAVLLTYTFGSRRHQNLGFAAAVWLLDAALCATLWVKLWCDYNGSQALCNAVAPLMFAVPALASLVSIGTCKTMMLFSDCVSLAIQPDDILLLVALPCLLSAAAPIMAWQAAFTLSLLIPFSLLTCLFFFGESPFSFSSGGVLSAGHLTIACCVLAVATAPRVLLRVRADRKLFAELEAAEADLAKSALQLNELGKRVQETTKALEDNRLENADKISRMRQFISYIFHEIRVPFNAVVLGIGHMLAESITDDQRDILKMMDSSASSMIHILNDVLDMGKIEAGRLHLQKQPFNIGDLVSSLVWSYQEIFDSKGVNFCLCIDDKTNQLLSSWDVMGDKHRVGQVLANYLSNAAKFTPRGGKVCLRVSATCSVEASSAVTENVVMDVSSLHSQGEVNVTKGVDGGPQPPDALKEFKVPTTVAKVTLSVEDTGIGISEEDQKRLFEPYMQVHATSSQAGGGTGLGLCFSKRIVELAAGSIGVQSQVGKGSTFLCTIPFELVPASPNGQVPHTRSTFDVSRALGGRPLQRCGSTGSLSAASLEGRVPKVLIVEDNQVNRRILNKLLSSFSVESEDVENGKQAVDLCGSGASFDMILIDKEMPVMDGPEATRQLRAMGITTPIVGLTGNALESERDHFLAAGVDDFFTKPLSRNQLLKLLEAYGLMAKSKSKEGTVQPEHSVSSS